METHKKFILPSPCFKEIEIQKIKTENSKPCLTVPQGDLLPMGPPMYGPRGSTIAPRFLGQYQQKNYQGTNQQHGQGFRHFNNEGKRFHNQNRTRQTAPIPSYQQDFTQQFWCETCDRSFNTSAKLESHKYEHQICGIDDCMFIGHPSIVAKHIEAQHTTGLYQKIKKLSTPEEITKWREERKKRYPTRANVELRQKAQAERMKRGEKLNEKKSRFGQQSDRRQMGKLINENTGNDRTVFKSRNQEINKSEGSDKGQHTGNNKKRRRKRLTREKKDVDSKKVAESNTNNDGIFNGNLKMFGGTFAIPDYHPKQVKQLEASALSNLLMYGSSSESETNDDEQTMLNTTGVKEISNFTMKPKEEENAHLCDKVDVKVLDKNTTINNIEENSNIKEKLLITEIMKNVPENKSITKDCREIEENINSDDMPDEEPIARKPEHELLPINVLTPNQGTSTANEPPPKRSRQNRHEKSNTKKKYNTLLDYSKLRTRRQNTMLEKLLESDIRHERNILLQCVRHTVKNNFFGIGEKKP